MIRKSISRSSEPPGEPTLDLENQKAWVPSLSTVAFLAKSLSDENRLRVLLSLREGRLSVSALVETLQLSQPLISHHLKELKRSLLVKVERQGPFVYYELADPRILQIIIDLETLAGKLLANRRTF
jgi:ArsR family transcriptional regulator, zinc-responsive transcriptional repressor